MLYDTIEAAETAIAQWLEANATMISTGACGLDERAGIVWVCDEAVVTTNRGRLDYYGGFEYVDKEYVKCVGNYTIYYAENDRVQECIDNWNERKEQTVE